MSEHGAPGQPAIRVSQHVVDTELVRHTFGFWHWLFAVQEAPADKGASAGVV